MGSCHESTTPGTEQLSSQRGQRRTADATTIEERIIEHCEVNLPDFKVVRRVHVVAEQPRSTLEKIAKNVLRLEPITEGR